MKKIVLLILCICSFESLFSQNEKKDGDDMAAAGNYSGAAMMYRLCMESDEQCLFKLFKLIYDEKIEPESSDELFQMIIPLAQNENAEGQYYLGELYLYGAGGVSRNFVEGVKWLQNSADKGYDEAIKKLHSLKEQIARTADDMVIAGRYDDASSMYRLCMVSNEQCKLKLFKLIHDGRIKPQTADESYRLVSALAKQGSAEAQYYLGMLYRKGTGGVLQDNSEATFWLQLSADQGFLIAQHELLALTAGKQETTATKEQESIDPPEQKTVVMQESIVSNKMATQTHKKNYKDNILVQKDKSSSKGSAILFAIGGVGIAAGTAAYFLMKQEKENWNVASENNHYYHMETSYNPVYLITGGVVGGVCIGTGIILKSKKNRQDKIMASEPNHIHSHPNAATDVRLNLVAAGAGAGFRLTF